MSFLIIDEEWGLNHPLKYSITASIQKNILTNINTYLLLTTVNKLYALNSHLSYPLSLPLSFENQISYLKTKVANLLNVLQQKRASE